MRREQTTTAQVRQVTRELMEMTVIAVPLAILVQRERQVPLVEATEEAPERKE